MGIGEGSTEGAAFGGGRSTMEHEAEHISKTLDEQIGEILEPKDIEAPPVHIHVALITHATKKDAEDLREDIEESDIVIPELTNAPKNYVRVLNDLAQGKITPFKAALKIGGDAIDDFFFITKGFKKAFFKVIYGSKKTIGHADIPKGHPLQKELDSSTGALTALENAVLGSKKLSYAEATMQAVQATENFVQAHQKRENFILGNLPRVIASLIENNPSLWRRQHPAPLVVMLWLGAGHVGIPKILQEAGNTVTSRVSKASRTPRYFRDAFGRARFGAQLTREDGEHIVLEWVFNRLYQMADKRKDTLFAPIRKLVGRRQKAIELISYVLASIFHDKGKEVYERFKKTSIFGQNALYDEMVAERHEQIEGEVERWSKVFEEESGGVS